MGHFASDAYEKFRYRIAEFTAGQLRLLLETKHLYQKVSLQPDELLAELAPPAPTKSPLGQMGKTRTKRFEDWRHLFSMKDSPSARRWCLIISSQYGAS